MGKRRQHGIKGSRKGTPYAAQLAAESAAKKAIDFGMKQVDVYVKDRLRT